LDDVLYELRQDLTVSANAARCRDAVGSRCCPGNRGEGCQSCCSSENLGVAEAREGTQQALRSCDHRTWHAVKGGGASSCYPCPQGKLTGILAVLAVLGILIVAPVVAKASAITKVLGAAQGPLLSILNLLQSSDLFQSLELKWPPEFRQFCNSIAAIFNLDLSNLIRVINLVIPRYLKRLIPGIPALDCIYLFPYETSWILKVASPLFVAVFVALLIPLRCLARPLIESKRTSHLIRHLFWLLFSALVGSMVGNSVQIWHGGRKGNKEFDPYTDDPIGATCGAVIAVICVCSRRWLCHIVPKCSMNGVHYCKCCVPAANTTYQRRVAEGLELESGTSVWAGVPSLQGPLLGVPERRSTDVDSPSSSITVTHDADVGSTEDIGPENTSSTDLQKSRRCSFKNLVEQVKRHDYQEYCRQVMRAVLMYFAIGYTFLVRTSLEPLSCRVRSDGRNFISVPTGSAIECNLCHTAADGLHLLSYRSLATVAMLAYTAFSIVPLLVFSSILRQNRRRLNSENFMRTFGFLASRMKGEFYAWEVVIFVRKLLLVTAVMASPGSEVAMAFANLMIIVASLMLQGACTFGLRLCVLVLLVLDASGLPLDVMTTDMPNQFDRLEASICAC
jgi:hypothetical protein